MDGGEGSQGVTTQRGPARARGHVAGPVSRIAHDPVAFEGFYTEHVAEITRFVARRVADPHGVADLTAEVFLAAIGSADAYSPGRGPQVAWLYGIARNIIAGERRRAAHEMRAAGRLAGRRLLDEDDIARLEDRIDAESPGRAAYLAMARLPDNERAVLELVALDGLSVKDAVAAGHRSRRPGRRSGAGRRGGSPWPVGSRPPPSPPGPLPSPHR